MALKHNILAILMGTLFILALISRYVALEFDLNLFHALTGSDEISSTEREWLKSHGGIIYGADQNSPPLRYVDEKSGQYKGIVVDYVRALSIELEIEIEFKPLVWSKALAELSEGITDFCDMFPSEERSKHYLFSDTIYNMRGLVLLPNSRVDPAKISQLNGLRIAAPKGDFVIEHLKKRVSSIRFSYTSDMREALLLLKEGHVDAVAGDEPVISHFLDILDMKNNFNFLEPPLYEMGNVLAVPKSEEILLNILNKGIRNLKRKRIMAKIQQKWFGISTPLIREKNSEKLLMLSFISLSVIGLIIYLFTTWNQLLKKEVDKRTRQLFESRANLQTTFDSLTYFMIVVDQDLKIINVNRSFCEYVGKSREKIIQEGGRQIGSLLADATITDMIQKTLNGNPPERAEFEFNGRPYRIQTFPLADRNQQICNVLCVIKDISLEKEDEKRLLHTNKMTAVGCLAAGVAHEIRNPLGLIRNHCYVLKKALKDKKTKQFRAVEVIENAVSQSNQIIDNLFNFSRMSGDRLEKVNIRRMLERMIALQNKTLSEKQVRIKIVCSKSLEGYINQEAFGHIIVNLLSNAIDAVQNNKGFCEITAWREKEMLILSFRDNGKGISPDIIENIFEPFFTTKSRGAGAGLGLYIAYNQAQKCGGRISVASRPNEGSTFRVEVPFRGSEETA